MYEPKLLPAAILKEPNILAGEKTELLVRRLIKIPKTNSKSVPNRTEVFFFLLTLLERRATRKVSRALPRNTLACWRVRNIKNRGIKEKSFSFFGKKKRYVERRIRKTKSVSLVKLRAYS